LLLLVLLLVACAFLRKCNKNEKEDYKAKQKARKENEKRNAKEKQSHLNQNVLLFSFICLPWPQLGSARISDLIGLLRRSSFVSARFVSFVRSLAHLLRITSRARLLLFILFFVFN